MPLCMSIRMAREEACPRSWPLHLRRQRRQDRVDIAAGLESENRAAVVEQVELDIASAPDQLLLAVFGRPCRREIATHDVRIGLQEGVADGVGEGEIGAPITAVVPVVENAADAARLFPV